MFFKAVPWLSSPYINQFLSADTIVPGYANPQNLNRFSYVTNNPLRYIDPTGHTRVEEPRDKRGCSNPRYCQNGKPKPPITAPKKPNGRGGGRTSTTSPTMSFTYDTQEIANEYVPGTASQWDSASSLLDKAALGADILAASVVLGHVVAGAAGGLTFEGNPVTGATGAAAGYIVGEMNPVVRALVGAGNVLAVLGTYTGLVRNAKTGDNRLRASINANSSQANISISGNISGNSVASVALTSAGLTIEAQPVSVSLPLQTAAVMNDQGTFHLPAWNFSTSVYFEP